MNLRKISMTGVACLLGATLAGSAWADAFDDALSLINRHIGPLRLSISAERAPVQLHASTVVLDRLVLNGPGMAIPVPGPIEVSGVMAGPADMPGVAMLPSGSFLISRVTLPRFEHENFGTTVLARDIVLDRLFVPPPGTTDPVLFAQAVGAVTIDSLLITNPEIKPIDVGQIAYSLDVSPGPGTATPDSVRVGGGVMGLTLTSELSRELGLHRAIGPAAALVESRKINILGRFSWSGDTGRFSADSVALQIPGLAAASAGATLNGLVRPLIEEMVAAAMAGRLGQYSPDQALAMRLLASISFEGAHAQFQNDTLVPILLAAFAMDRGTDLETAKKAVLEELSRNLGAIGAPEFAADVEAKVAAFLDNPGALRIEARPKNPHTALLIQIAALAGYPAQLIDFLGVTVTAVPPIR